MIKKYITENRVLELMALALMVLGLLGLNVKAETLEVHNHNLPTNAENIDITEADVKYAKDKVVMGMRVIDDYWKQAFRNGNLRYSSPEVYYYYQPIQTGCGTISMENGFYCSADNSIYLDIYFFTRMMKAVGDEFGTDGDMAIITVLAHEWGHAVQAQTNNFWKVNMLNELGADCFAGAFVGYSQSLGYIENGDAEEALMTLYIGGDNLPWYAPQSHGSSQNRIDSFQRGFSEGIAPCQAG